MTIFKDYSEKFPNIKMTRTDGVLELMFHSEGQSLQWNLEVHSQLPEAFLDIARDQKTEVVIMTGCGKDFSGPRPSPEYKPGNASAHEWDNIYREGKALLMNLLDIEVPIIAAVNGPALRHCEIPLLSDIVIASETAVFQDSAHFSNDMTPGDGMHIVIPMLLGPNRGRYFLLTGQTLSATEAKKLGLIAEILAPEELRNRSYDLAEILLRQSRLTRRYSRIALTQSIRKQMHDLLGYGLALEGLGILAPKE